MAASRPKTFRLGHDLVDALSLRAKELGYHSETELIEALCRYDILCRSSHGVTTRWARLSRVEQDDLERRLLDRTKEKKGMRSSQAADVDWRTL